MTSKRNTSIVIFLLSVFCLFFSCKKETENTTNNPANGSPVKPNLPAVPYEYANIPLPAHIAIT